MDRYDVVVIGAGILGLSSAYHIKLRNRDLNIAVVDRLRSYAQGNTGRATAGFRDLFSSQVNFDLAFSSISFYRHIQESVKFNIGFRPVGYMFLLDEQEEKQNVFSEISRKTSVTWLEKDELDSIPSLSTAPGCAEKSVLGLTTITSAFAGLNCGIIEPDLVASFYVEELKRMGVKFLFDTNVTRLVLGAADPLDYPGEPFVWQEKLIDRLETSRGEIKADFYVIATDVWTNEILDPVGVDSYMRPRKRQVFQLGGSYVEALLGEFSLDGSGVFPFTVLPHFGVHFRPAPGEKQIRVSAPDYIGRNFSLEDYPEAEPGFFEYSIKPVLGCYFPCLSGEKPRGMWAGYYSYNSLDGHPVIFRELNFILATGTSGSGLMKGDAIGRIVESIYSGRDKASLYTGSVIHNSDLGVTERNVPAERFLL